jgi:nicotinamide mononucleotide transporter
MSVASIVSYFVGDWIEWAGFITAVVGIWYSTKRRVINWPITLVSDILYFVVFMRANLMSSAWLQFAFLAFTFYGWWNWAHGAKQGDGIRVEKASPVSLAVALLLGAAGSGLWGWLMAREGAALPYVDAAVSVFSLVATWWETRKHTANWWLWIVVNVVAVGEYMYQKLWPTVILYLILIGLAFLGLRNWRLAAATSDSLVPSP